MDDVRPVVFANDQGQRLFGMLHRPSSLRDNGQAILLLSPGVKGRVAPHRLYVKMATRFCEWGFTVLRFDFHGLGDSEGEIEERFLADFYGTVQVGRYIKDTRSAMDWMQKEYGTSRFILAGLCGGAITGMFASCEDGRVAGLLGLGIPVILDSSRLSQLRYVTQGQLREMRGSYLRKLLSPKAWRRFVNLRSDLSVIGKILIPPFFRRVKSPPWEATPAGSATPAVNTNPLFAPAFFKAASGNRRILLVFGGADRLVWEFNEKFAELHRDRLIGCRDQCEIETIENANHILTSRDWQEAMMARTRVWLARHFAPMPGMASGSR